MSTPPPQRLYHVLKINLVNELIINLSFRLASSVDTQTKNESPKAALGKWVAKIFQSVNETGYSWIRA